MSKPPIRSSSPDATSNLLRCMYVMKIGEVCQLNMGQSPDSSSYNGNQEGLPFFQGNADFGDLYPKCRVWCSAPSKIAEKNDILISVRAPIGALNIADTRCCIGRGLAAVRPLESVNIDYIYYFLLAKREYLISQGTGSTFKAISKSVLQELPIILPSISEQEYRVCVLKRIRGIICKHRETLNELDELVKARFVEMFGDFVENPRNWRVEELGDYIVFMTSGPRGWSKYFSDAGEYFLTIRNVKGCNVFTENIQHVRCPNNAEADRAKVKEGDLLISITADLGRTGVVSEQIANHGTYINQHLMCVRLMKEMLHPVYVAHLLESEGGRLQFSQKNQSAVKAGLNYESIRTLKIMVPPMHLQLAFVAFITQVDKSKVVVEMRGKNLTWRERCAKRVNEAFSIPNLSFSRDYGLGICTGKTQAD